MIRWQATNGPSWRPELIPKLTTHGARQGAVALQDLVQMIDEKLEAAESLNPQGPSTQYLRSLVPNTIKSMVFGTRNLNYWVLGPSGDGLRNWARL